MCARRAAYIEISILGFTTHAMTSQVAVYTPAEVGTGCHPTGGYPFRRWGGCRSRNSPGDPKHDQYGPKATQTWIQDGPNSLQTHLRWNQDADQRRRNVREASGRCSGSRFGRRKACWEGDIGGARAKQASSQNRTRHGYSPGESEGNHNATMLILSGLTWFWKVSLQIKRRSKQTDMQN